MNRKIKILSISVIILIFSLLTTCFATNSNAMDITSGDASYISSYEEYEELMNGANGYTQEELKEYYEYYMTSYKDHMETEYAREEFVKAKVTQAGEVETVYDLNEGYEGTTYYSVPFKYDVQTVEVEILEGEYQGQKFEIEYFLNSWDMLSNIKYSELKKGDTVFVILEVEEESNEVVVQLTEDGANIERFDIVVCIGIIAIILLIIYGGKKGIIASLLTLLMIVFCIIIIPNLYATSGGFVIGGIALMALLIILVSLSELGINKKALKAIILSVILTIFTLILVVVVNYLTGISGVTLGAIAFSNLTLTNEVDMESLYVIITLIISALTITNLVCKTISRLSNEKAKDFNEKLDKCKDLLAPNVLMVAIILLASYIPNHLYLVTNKYTGVEICNSETLIAEIIRLFVIISAMALTLPTVIAFSEDEK